MAYGLTKSLDLESGSSQYGAKSDTASLSQAGDMSIESWLNVESIPALMGIFCKGTAGSSNLAYNLSITAGGLLQFLASSDGTSSNRDQIETDAAVFSAGNFGTWVHVAVTYDLSARDAVFYVNGSEVASTPDTAGTMASVFDSAADLNVGARAAANFYDGKISLVRYWSDIRTQSEIDNNKCNVFGTAEAGMIGEWSLNDVYTNYSGGESLTLTPSGTPAFVEDVPSTCTVSGPANLKTYNTNAKANIKTINTNAIANVKTLDTNA